MDDDDDIPILFYSFPVSFCSSSAYRIFSQT